MVFPSPLQECASTRLHRLVRLVDDIYRVHLHPIGLSESQVSILMTVSSEGPLFQAVLGKVLHLQRSTVTRNLDRLIKMGHIEKTGSSSKPEIRLTRKGKSFMKKVLPAWQAAVKEVNDLLGSSGTSAISVLERRISED